MVALGNHLSYGSRGCVILGMRTRICLPGYGSAGGSLGENDWKWGAGVEIYGFLQGMDTGDVA